MAETETGKELITADIFRILSKGFSYPSDAVLSELTSIANELISSGSNEKSFSDQLKKIIKSVNPNEIRRDYSRIFITGAVPLTESNCLSSMNSVTDVSAFYKAFGLNPKSGDSPDSITYQLEFTAMLFLKISLAENKEQSDISKKALMDFFSQHVEPFSKKFASRILEKNPGSFYSALTGLLEITVKETNFLK